MKEKLNNSIQKISGLIPDYFPFVHKEGEPVYHMKIPAVGVQESNVHVDAEEGIIIVDGDFNIVVEEDERYCPWNRYSTYGFYRSYILPEGISVKDVHVKIDKNGLQLGWVD